MEERQFKTGKKVNIVNSGIDGKFIIEGVATVVGRQSSDGMYPVSFGDGTGKHFRFIDPAAQEGDGWAYVETLNNKTRGLEA